MDILLLGKILVGLQQVGRLGQAQSTIIRQKSTLQFLSTLKPFSSFFFFFFFKKNMRRFPVHMRE
jgi:hypothetical protein